MIALNRLNAVKMGLETGKSLLINGQPKCVASRTCKTDQRAKHMAALVSRSYEDAIVALNGLQTNANTVKESIGRAHNTDCPHIKETEKYLNKIGVLLSDLDGLSVIHVAGTKGKGSTCALVESMLRHLNVKTGFYSSPHLVNVTERIRLNGQPITKRLFSHYFWKIYTTLEQTKEKFINRVADLLGDLQQHENDMPPYFKFLTILAYYVFLKEQVDVAVVEVGIGGEYDCTNVIRNTQTVGITSLGLEHTSLLGSTYEDIAWQKSGIIKPNCSVYTAPQHVECVRVMNERAAEKHATVHTVPAFDYYKFPDETQFLRIASNPMVKLNASLAIQLSYDWIRKNPLKITDQNLLSRINGPTLPSVIVDGLMNCYWPGRCQALVHRGNTIYIDGAHTIDSLGICVDWFRQSVAGSKHRKYLVFNVTGERNAENMLNILNKNFRFEEALFMPNTASLLSRTKDNMYKFEQPNNSKQHSTHWNSLSPTNRSTAFACIADAFDYLEEQKICKNEELTILVTGSLHLVGEVIRLIRGKTN